MFHVMQSISRSLCFELSLHYEGEVMFKIYNDHHHCNSLAVFIPTHNQKQTPCVGIPISKNVWETKIECYSRKKHILPHLVFTFSLNNCSPVCF